MRTCSLGFDIVPPMKVSNSVPLLEHDGSDPLFQLGHAELERFGGLPGGVLDLRLLLRGQLNPDLLVLLGHNASEKGDRRASKSVMESDDAANVMSGREFSVN